MYESISDLRYIKSLYDGKPKETLNDIAEYEKKYNVCMTEQERDMMNWPPLPEDDQWAL